jgi:sugar phosphate isomerase/epimerase
VENLFPSLARNSSINCNFEQISDLMDNLPKEVGLLLDLGHMNISSKIMEFDRFEFLDKYLSKYGDRLREIHISENSGLKDEHRALDINSWQYDAIKLISQIKTSDQNESKKIYCLESRNAKTDDIKLNLEKINSIIN